MAQDDGRELHLFRLDDFERRLIRNYRSVNETRQDTLLFFSDELVKLEYEDLRASSNNVVPLLANQKK
jgi:hypothetical protein